MPLSQEAVLRHALLYLRQLVAANDGYLAGGDEMLNALKAFDMDWGNIAAAQSRLAGIAANFNEKNLDDKDLRYLLDFCNSYPDAGAYIISLRLPPQERIVWLESALEASRILKNDLTSQAHLGNIGLAYMELGEVQKAIEYFEQALNLAEQINEALHQGIWAGNLGNAYASLSQHEKAIEYHQKHLSIALEQNDLRNQGHAHTNLGVSYAALSRNEESLQSYQTHLAIARQLDDARETCHALVNLGFSQYDLGKLEDAKSSLDEAVLLSQALNDHALLALAYGGLADILIDWKDYPQAKSLLEKALDSLRDFPDAHVEMRLLASLGNACNASDDLTSALEYYNHLFQLAESIGDVSNQVFAISNKVSVILSQGDFSQARSLAEKGFLLAREIHSQSDKAFLQWQMGLIHEALGDFKEAITLMEQAILYYEKNYHPDYERYLSRLNDVKEKISQG